MQINIKLEGFSALKNKLHLIENKAADTSGLMSELSNHLYNTVDRSFEKQETPDGISWNPIKTSTHKRKNGSQKILYASGNMQNSLSQASDKNTATVGLNATKNGYPYPEVQQFGKKDGSLKARAFMPIHLDGTLYQNIEKELEEILEDYIEL